MPEELAAIQQLTNTLIEFLVQYSFQIVGAIIILLIGLKVAGWLARLILGVCEKHGLDITLSRFLASSTKVIVIVFVVIIAMGKFGISIAPFIAALGAVAFGSSFAIQGPLSNYGAGLSIILTRPFVIGNTITVKGVSGVVKEIHLAATILNTEDNEEITIPNKHIVGEILHNSFANKVVESSVGISYDDDPGKVIALLKKTLSELPEVSGEQEPQIGVDEFADSAITIGLRYWVPTNTYHQARFKVNGEVHRVLNEAGITIPFPQRDVHLVKEQV